MDGVVFKLALAVVLASAIFFLLAVSFSQVERTANNTAGNIETARRTSLNKSVQYLQQ